MILIGRVGYALVALDAALAHVKEGCAACSAPTVACPDPGLPPRCEGRRVALSAQQLTSIAINA
jgi:hypothetical protein